MLRPSLWRGLERQGDRQKPLAQCDRCPRRVDGLQGRLVRPRSLLGAIGAFVFPDECLIGILARAPAWRGFDLTNA